MNEFSDGDAKELESGDSEGGAKSSLPQGRADRSEEFEQRDEDDDDENDDDEDNDDEQGLGKFDPTPPIKLQQSIERLDALLLESVDDEKIRAGMGIRIALGMAQELKYGLPLGTETGDLVQGWVLTYGQENVDAAVAIARQFLIKPGDMRKALGQRLGLGDET